MGKILANRLKQEKFESPEQEAVLNILVTSNFFKTKLESVCSNYGITQAQYNVLRILKGIYPDGYPRCEIISRMIDPSPDVTRLLDRLIKARLVERFNSNEDRRLSIARITKKGIELLEKMYPEISVFNNLLKNNLTAEESKMISNICEKIYGSEK
ncbi:MAG TPA: hypothetical protein VKA26_09345 [Ignavibacteriaceae bacterium]|nr:hypothetical protein [Ignavibacteriaceae bacterium]